MSQEVKTENKMGTKPMLPLILSMSLPAMFSMTIMAMYNVVDSIFIGNYDQDGLTAISLAYPLQLFLIAAAVGTAIGVNSLVSRKLGEKDFNMANNAATHGLVTCLITYAVFLMLGLFAVQPFMGLFTTDAHTADCGVQYLRIVLCFSLFSTIQVMIEKMLQATGNMIYPMLFQLLGAVVNIIFDPLLIFGIGFFPEMGVTGAAVATVFGQFCGMIFAVIILIKKNHEINVSFKNFRLQPVILYFKLQSFVFMPCFGLNQGVMPVIGYNYGARNKKRVYSALKCGIVIALIIMSIGVLLMWLIPDVLISMFGGGQELMNVGVPAFRTISLCFLPAAAGILFTTLFQAVGKGVRSLMMSVCRQLLILLPVAFILSQTLGVHAVWYAFPIAEIGCLILATIFFLNLVNGDFKKLN